MNEGLVLIAAWTELAVILAALSWVVLRRGPR